MKLTVKVIELDDKFCVGGGYCAYLGKHVGYAQTPHHAILAASKALVKAKERDEELLDEGERYLKA